jgi:hypothetical protein
MMNLNQSLKSIIIPEKDSHITDLKNLFSNIYKKQESLVIKNFIRDLLQVLNIYDFDFIKFTFDKNENCYICYLSELEIFKLTSSGLIICIDPLPINKEYKTKILSIINETKQSTPNMQKEYGTNVIFVFCDPEYLEDLKTEFLKGFKFLITNLMDNSFSSKDIKHNLEFLSYFGLEFLLENENKKNQKERRPNEGLLDGEDTLIEYKPSIFWSNNDLSNIKMTGESKLKGTSQNEILRTINGFMNSEGGTLIIGLHDKHKESSDSNQNVPRKDFQDEFYKYPSFDKFLLDIGNLLKFGFEGTSDKLCKIEQINLGKGIVFDEEIIPSSKSNFREKFVNTNRDRILLKITVEKSKKPVFVSLINESCKNHKCEDCPGTLSSSRFHKATNIKAFFVRSSVSATEQYDFEKLIEHISINHPQYFNFIADINLTELQE